METLKELRSLNSELSYLLVRYDHALIQEGVLSDEEKRINKGYQVDIEKKIEIVRNRIAFILK